MAMSAEAGRLFWRCASELRRILKENLTDEGKCFAIETLVSEVREELRLGLPDAPPDSSEG